MRLFLEIRTLQSSSMGVDIFFSEMRSYFCLLVAAFSPCHGSDPRLKYIKTYPRDSKSSLLDCSIPKCVFILAYLAVPKITIGIILHFKF